MQDINLIQEFEIGPQVPPQELPNLQFISHGNQNQINYAPFEFQKQNSQNNGDLPNLLDLNLELPQFSKNLNQNGFSNNENDKAGAETQSCIENVGRQQVFPPTFVVKKNVSIQNNHIHHQYPYNHQSSEDLRSLTHSQSRFSNRKTDATSGKHSLGRDCMSSSFFSEGEESNISRKSSDAVPPISNTPSIISTTSETAGQKNSIKLGNQSSQAFNRSSNQIKKTRNSLVCIEDLIFQQSLDQEEEQPEGKVIRVQLPSQNNNFQDESDANNEQAMRVPPVQSQQQIIGTNAAIKSPTNEQINQQIQQGDIKSIINNNNNNIIINPIITNSEQKLSGVIQNQNNLPDLLDEGSFMNITVNNNSSSGEQKTQNDTSPQGNSGPITDKDSPNKSESDCKMQNKPPTMNVLQHLNEDETSSDDPEMIKPVGFTIHIDHQEEQDGNNTSVSISSKKKRKNVISYKDLNYKQITYIEAWSRVKTMDLSKEKKLLMIIRDKMYQGQGIFSKVFTFCTNNSSKNLHLPQLTIERDQILAFSKVPFDTSDSLHVNMIYTIYCSLKNTQYCPLYGPHWLTIGFRHVNPKQNFEIAGVFGALQILAFIFCYKEYLLDVISSIDALDKKNEESRNQMQVHHEKQHNSHNSQNHNNSQNSSSVNCNHNCNYPERLRFKEINLCVVMQEISKHVLIWLEKGLLNQIINVEKSVISVVNKIYFATFYIFYEKFKKEQSGFLSISIAFKSTIDLVEQNPYQALETFKKKISLYYKLRD